LIVGMGLRGSERFTPALQDRMAMHLGREAGLEAWSATWSPAAAAWRRPARSAPCTPGGPDVPSPALSCPPGSRSRQATGTGPFC
jgi:hypothetical protein